MAIYVRDDHAAGDVVGCRGCLIDAIDHDAVCIRRYVQLLGQIRGQRLYRDSVGGGAARSIVLLLIVLFFIVVLCAEARRPSAQGDVHLHRLAVADDVEGQRATRRMLGDFQLGVEELSTFSPLMPTMMSPGCNPAFAPGVPGSTFEITAPCSTLAPN